MTGKNDIEDAIVILAHFQNATDLKMSVHALNPSFFLSPLDSYWRNIEAVNLKSKLGGGDHTLLETAEESEDAAKDAYNDALKHELPLPLRQLLTEQQSHILMSHAFVREQRDARKAA